VMFTLKFALLFGWVRWELALAIVIIDWGFGMLIYILWINTPTDIPHCVPREIRFISQSTRSNSRLAA